MDKSVTLSDYFLVVFDCNIPDPLKKALAEYCKGKIRGLRDYAATRGCVRFGDSFLVPYSQIKALLGKIESTKLDIDHAAKDLNYAGNILYCGCFLPQNTETVKTKSETRKAVLDEIRNQAFELNSLLAVHFGKTLSQSALDDLRSQMERLMRLVSIWGACFPELDRIGFFGNTVKNAFMRFGCAPEALLSFGTFVNQLEQLK
jgi:hypothetical protein